MTHFMFAGLSLRAGGQALPPATMSMTTSYLTRKKKGNRFNRGSKLISTSLKQGLYSLDLFKFYDFFDDLRFRSHFLKFSTLSLF